MFKIEGKDIHLTRGDNCTIAVKLKINKTNSEKIPYVFKPGDIVSIGVYNAKGFNSDPLLFKEVEVSEQTEEVYIILSSDETKVGEMSNKVIKYWYEIQLNHNQTIIGYDDNGPKLLYLYPEGVDNI